MIQDLPKAASENVVLQTAELKCTPEEMQEINGQLQQLNQTNALDLPSRDIPTQTTSFTQDKQIQANYVPSPTQTDYIEEAEEAEKEEPILQISNEERQEELYDELQGPVFVMILFFLFQMPFVRKALKKYIPTLFHHDNNLTLGGYMFTTFLFGGTFYGLQRFMNYLTVINSKINNYFTS